MASTPERAIETLLVPLQGSDALQSVQALRRANDTFLIVSKNDDPESEPWEFPSGSLVRGERRVFGSVEHWVAVEAVPPMAPLRLAATNDDPDSVPS